MNMKRPSGDVLAAGSRVVNLSPTKRRRRNVTEYEVTVSNQENACDGVNGALNCTSDESEVEEQEFGKRIEKQKDIIRRRRNENLKEKMLEEEEVRRRALLPRTSCEGRRNLQLI